MSILTTGTASSTTSQKVRVSKTFSLTSPMNKTKPKVRKVKAWMYSSYFKYMRGNDIQYKYPAEGRILVTITYILPKPSKKKTK